MYSYIKKRYKTKLIHKESSIVSDKKQSCLPAYLQIFIDRQEQRDLSTDYFVRPISSIFVTNSVSTNFRLELTEPSAGELEGQQFFKLWPALLSRPESRKINTFQAKIRRHVV